LSTATRSATDLVAQRRANPGVECRERLVEQQHRRRDGQRAGQRHPLLLPERDVAHASTT
jgi:hypothetical protein